MKIKTNPEARLSEDELDSLARQLMEKRSQLSASVDELNRDITARQDCSITDAGEAAALREFRARAAGVAEQHHQTIAEIDHALQKMEGGLYGVCEQSGDPIPYQRLRTIPWTRVGVTG